MAQIQKTSIENGVARSTWTDSMTLKLIRMYKQNEHLWNRNSPLFGSPTPRTLTWQQMSQKLNVTIQEVTLKIRSLRKIFKSNWRKVQATGTSLAIKWRYYDKLKFIETSFHTNEVTRQQNGMKKKKPRASPKQRPLASTPRPASAPSNDTMDNSVTNTSATANANDTETSTETFLGFSSTNNDNAVRNGHQGDESDDIYIACDSIPIKRCEPPMSTMPKMKYHEVATTPTARQVELPQTNDDRLYGFFRSMADTVKMFPPRLIAEVKLNLATMIGQIELQLASGEEILCGISVPDSRLYQHHE